MLLVPRPSLKSGSEKNNFISLEHEHHSTKIMSTRTILVAIELPTHEHYSEDANVFHEVGFSDSQAI